MAAAAAATGPHQEHEVHVAQDERGRRRRGKGVEGEEDMEPQDKDVAAASASAKIASEEREGKTRAQCDRCRSGLEYSPCLLDACSPSTSSACGHAAPSSPLLLPASDHLGSPGLQPLIVLCSGRTFANRSLCILAFSSSSASRTAVEGAGHLHGDQEELSPSPTRATPLT
ncbi:uncharacterized protein LOC123418645 [Hordeum vulgare subsp. vulgare]|uniref:uncharacterized protein LOC123418645 n=1 Tax=Hordeum vulgare subsp. vulgare TaxID=112509 RepID=UPI001D1A539D|nr:uncharacterized protein LOC123418645 [Hordeum vulgare subsp. vulgare]